MKVKNFCNLEKEEDIKSKIYSDLFRYYIFKSRRTYSKDEKKKRKKQVLKKKRRQVLKKEKKTTTKKEKKTTTKKEKKTSTKRKNIFKKKVLKPNNYFINII